MPACGECPAFDQAAMQRTKNSSLKLMLNRGVVMAAHASQSCFDCKATPSVEAEWLA